MGSGIKFSRWVSLERDGLKSLLRSYRAGDYLVPLVILLHLSITLFLAAMLNIWVDEAYSLSTSGGSIERTLRQALHFELQPPLYFILLNIWRKLDDSILFARLFSVTCAALTLIVTSGLARRFVERIHPAWVVTAVAFNPFIIWAAVEIRGYALVVLLSAFLLLFFYDGYLAAVSRRRRQWYYLLCSILALYTQYYLGFLLLAGAFVLLALKRWRALLAYLLGMAGVGICFVPMAEVVLAQLHDHTKTIASTVPWFKGLGIISWRVQEYLLPIQWSRLMVWRRWILRLGALVAVVLMIRRKGILLTPAAISLWITTAVLSLCLLGVLRLTGVELFLPQHTASLFLPITLIVFSIVTTLIGKRGLILWSLFALLFNVSSLCVQYTPMAKSGDWSRVASYLVTNEKAGQAIIVFHADSVLPLAYYYSGKNALVPIPKKTQLERFDLQDFVIRDEEQLISLFSSVSGDQQQIWLVTDSTCGYLEVNFNCSLLEEFISKYYIVESDKSFFRSQVRLLRRNSLPWHLN